MISKRLRSALALALALPCAANATMIWYTAANAIADYDGDGVPDALTPSSSNYVANYTYANAPEVPLEWRTFVEFALPSSIPDFQSASFNFIVGRNNTPHVPAQQIAAYAYFGNGTVELSDWNAPGVLLGLTTPIAGYLPDLSNQGEGLQFNLDVTTQLKAAIAANASHFSVYFLNPSRSTVDSSDPLGYSSLLTVGNYEIMTRETPVGVADTGSTLGLSVAALAGLIALHRRRRSELGAVAA